jgi:hypothetical protein
MPKLFLGGSYAALGVLRMWLIDEETAAEFAELFRELRSVGRVMSQFDLLIAALARQRGLILLTADQDFRPVTGLQVEINESWRGCPRLRWGRHALSRAWPTTSHPEGRDCLDSVQR